MSTAEDLTPPNGVVEPTPPAAPPRRSGMGFFGVAVMSLLAAAGGAVAALYAPAVPQIAQFLPTPAAVAPPQGLDGVQVAQQALRAEVEGLKARVALLEGGARAPPAAASSPAAETAEAPAGPPPATPAPDGQALRDLAARVASLETRLAALDPAGAGGAVIAALQADVAALKAQVEVLRAEAAQPRGPSPAAAFAALSLAEASARPGPFAAEWEQARMAAPGDPAIAALADLAKKGAPTRAQLAERFPQVQSAIQAAARNGPEAGGGFWGWLTRFFANLFTVRTTAGPSGTGPDAIAARAKLKLDQGDLAGAVDDLNALTGAPAAAAAPWVVSAQDRLEIETRVAAARAALQSAATPPAAPAPAEPAGAPAP